MSDPAKLFDSVYSKLHALAAKKFRAQPAGMTLQPTALVHEVYLRLARADAAAFRDREHFLAIAATAMRQILIDQARRRQAGKRGGAWARVTLGDALSADERDAVDILAMDAIVARLAELNPRQAQILEMRVFAGMTVPEVATGLGVSPSTVEKEWRRARAWMRAELEGGGEAAGDGDA